MEPLSKYMVVKYDNYFPNGEIHWDIYKAQYLDTLEEAKFYIKSLWESEQFDPDEITFKIFELKEVAVCV